MNNLEKEFNYEKNYIPNGRLVQTTKERHCYFLGYEGDFEDGCETSKTPIFCAVYFRDKEYFEEREFLKKAEEMKLNGIISAEISNGIGFVYLWGEFIKQSDKIKAHLYLGNFSSDEPPEGDSIEYSKVFNKNSKLLQFLIEDAIKYKTILDDLGRYIDSEQDYFGDDDFPCGYPCDDDPEQNYLEAN